MSELWSSPAARSPAALTNVISAKLILLPDRDKDLRPAFQSWAAEVHVDWVLPEHGIIQLQQDNERKTEWHEDR